MFSRRGTGGRGEGLFRRGPDVGVDQLVAAGFNALRHRPGAQARNSIADRSPGARQPLGGREKADAVSGIVGQPKRDDLS